MSLFVLDDSFEEIFNDKELVKIATAGYHRNIMLQRLNITNLYQESRWSNTIDLKTNHLILINSPRDVQQIEYLG